MLNFVMLSLLTGSVEWLGLQMRNDYSTIFGENSYDCSCFAHTSSYENTSGGHVVRRRWAIDTNWKETELTYAFVNYTKDLTPAVIDQIAYEAFQVWAGTARLNISKALNITDAHIKISFVKEAHRQLLGFPCNFENNRHYAHAFVPSQISKGVIHINDYLKWMSGECRDDQYQNNDQAGGPKPPGAARYHGTTLQPEASLFNIFVHEIGHVLGMEHSNVPGSIMYHKQERCAPEFYLTRDDIDGIQNLYVKTYKPKASDDICKNASIDAIYYSENNTYVAFKGENVYEFLWGAIIEGFPKNISDYYPELPSNIGAVFGIPGYTFIYKGNSSWGYVKRIKSFKSPKSKDLKNIDAVFTDAEIIPVYIKGDIYFRTKYHGGFSKKNITDEKISNKVSAAIRIPHVNEIYLFMGTQYARVDSSLKINGTYPQDTAKDWFGCP